MQKYLGIEICLDLNIGVSAKRNFCMINGAQNNNDYAKLFIVQSNIISTHDNNMQYLPFNTVILHSDKGVSTDYKNSAGLRFLRYIRKYINNAETNFGIEVFCDNTNSEIFIPQDENNQQNNINWTKYTDYVNITSVDFNLNI